MEGDRSTSGGGQLVRLRAPAKLTVRLAVTGTRADGLHLIAAEMVCLDLADDLDLTPGAPVAVTADGPFADELPPGGDDLVSRALRLAGRSAAVRVHKRIPAGAGLGGGSADAAAVLRWAGWRPTPAELERAAGLGADVAFCLAGGRARVEGIGEQVVALEPEAHTYTLVTPPLWCATPAVYRAWDRLGGPRGDAGNDLEPAALAVEPALAGWRDRIEALCGQRPRLAGSGSTWFVEGDHSGPLAVLEAEARLVAVARTVPAGWGGPGVG